MLEIKINLADALKSNAALTPMSGAKIYKLLDEEMSKDLLIKLDFSGMEVITAAFLNASIGQLFKKYSSQELNDRLTLLNISLDDLNRLKLVIRRAKEYFSVK